MKYSMNVASTSTGHRHALGVGPGQQLFPREFCKEQDFQIC